MVNIRWSRRGAVVVGAVALVGCGDADPGRSEATVRDSAGVTRIRAPAAPLPEWRAGEAVRIGSLDGDPSTLFQYVSAIGVGPAGEVYVVDGAAPEIRVFGPDGLHRRSFGGAGGGPGEARQYVSGTVVGDTVLVMGFGGGPMRWHVFAAGGDVLGTWVGQAPGMAGGSFTLEARDGRRWLGVGQRFPGDVLPAPGEDVPMVLSAVAMDPATGTPSPLPLELPGQVYRSSGAGHAAPPRAFAASPVLRAMPDGRFAYTPASRWVVDVYDPQGRLLRRSTRDQAVRTVDETLRLSFVDAIRDAYPMQGPDPRTAAEELAESRAPEPGSVVAPIQDLLVGRDGSLWLRVRDLDASPGELVQPEVARSLPDAGTSPPSVWDVIDAQGVPRGRVRLPASFTPMAVAVDHVWGVDRDALDVQYVVRLDLHPRAA